MRTINAVCCLAIGVAALVLSGCAMRSTGTTAAPVTSATKTFVSHQYGVRVRYPADLELRHSFKRSYLANGAWKTYAGPDAPPGKPLIALVLPDSNKITAGELRLGVSRNKRALKTCTKVPSAVRPGSKGYQRIDGIKFRTYKAGDAAMSHYLIVRSFRAVHGDTCFAIDVLVFGTNPEVYAPPATPPFSKAHVFARLVPVAKNIQFMAPVKSALSPPATYTGQLPCADCPGIDYQLNLLKHHRYVLRMTYRDRDTHYDERGHWHLKQHGNILLLKNNNPNPQQWKVLNGGSKLRLLNQAGHEIHSKLNYDLTRGANFTPIQSKRGR